MVNRRIGRGVVIVLAAGTLGLAGTGCASTAGTAQLQSDLDALQQQVWKIQKDSAALAQQVAQAGQPPVAPAPGQPVAELRARLETVAGEVQVLRTRADESEQRLAALLNEMRAARESLDTIARAQAARPAPPSPVVPAPGTDPGGQAGGAIPVTASQAPPPAAAEAPGAPSAGTDLYRQAYSDYARGNYDQALSSLEEFLRLHPADDRADDAQYLIGEVYFGQQKYPEAVGAYDRLLKDHADGERAASAHLRKGLALLEMNRTADAVIQFQHVVTAYPKSEEDRAARERLRALGLRER